MRKQLTAAAVALLLAAGLGGPAFAAAEEAVPSQHWSFFGAFGTYDRAALQRGYQVYKEVCAACHSMKYLAFRNLEDIGLNEAEVKALAAEFQIADGPNDKGEMFERPGRPSDHFKPPFPNDQAARAAFGGALPPDLSLMAKARPGGPDYTAALLTGFKDAPAGFKVPEGLYYNEYFPGHKIAMPPPLSDGQVTFADGTKASVQQMSRDVSTFLMWAAEPKLEDRHRLGLKVVIFLLVLCGLFFFAKRKIWAEVH